MVDTIAILLAGLCLWAILSPRVPTGAILTVGLGVTVAACLAALDDRSDIRRILALAALGDILIVVGLLWRSYGKRRRCTDVGRVLTDEEKVKVAGGSK